MPTLQFMKEVLEKAGFKNVTTLKVKEPMGPWAKDPKLRKFGAMTLLHSDGVFESYGMAAFTRLLEMDVEKAHGICQAAHRAARNKNYGKSLKYH